ncbi:MAG: hypothetical protein PARBB_03253 [Parabacteroides distasonis]
MAIPKIIHQVWEGRTEPCMPTRLQILARTWREQNPDWEYHLWSGEEMDELVEKYFPEYLSMYRSFPYNVQRWDTIRYMILYVYGGVYTDLDTECFKSINPLIDGRTMGIGEEPPVKEYFTCIGNAFLFSERNCSGWLTILENIKLNTSEKESSIMTIMDSTGAFMIDRLFEQLKEKNGVYRIPYEIAAPVNKYEVRDYIFRGKRDMFQRKIKNAYCAHYFFGSWDTRLTFY